MTSYSVHGSPLTDEDREFLRTAGPLLGLGVTMPPLALAEICYELRAVLTHPSPRIRALVLASLVIDAAEAGRALGRSRERKLHETETERAFRVAQFRPLTWWRLVRPVRGAVALALAASGRNSVRRSIAVGVADYATSVGLIVGLRSLLPRLEQLAKLVEARRARRAAERDGESVTDPLPFGVTTSGKSMTLDLGDVASREAFLRGTDISPEMRRMMRGDS